MAPLKRISLCKYWGPMRLFDVDLLHIGINIFTSDEMRHANTGVNWND